MPQEVSEEMLPPYYKLGTLADFSRVARKMALANQAFRSISEVERLLGTMGDVSEEDFAKAVSDVENFAWMGVERIKQARVIVAEIKANVEDYLRTV